MARLAPDSQTPSTAHVNALNTLLYELNNLDFSPFLWLVLGWVLYRYTRSAKAPPSAAPADNGEPT